jgi:hypothetical protein
MKKLADTVINTNTGRPMKNALVELLFGGIVTTIYTDNAQGGAALGMYTNGNGLYEFYAPDGAYTLRISYGGEIITITDIEIYDDSEDRAKTARAILVPTGEVGPTLPAAADRTGKFLVGVAGGGIGVASGTGADANLRNDLSATNGSALVEYDGSTVKAALDSIAAVRAGKSFITQGSAVGGTGAQVEIAYDDAFVMPATGIVKFTAVMTCGPSGAGAAWNTHFRVDGAGLIGIRGFEASASIVNFTNIAYATVTAGTHRISLYWFGGNGLIGVGGTEKAILIAEAM